MLLSPKKVIGWPKKKSWYSLPIPHSHFLTPSFPANCCKTAFCTELNLLTPFSFGKDNCLIVEIILHLNGNRLSLINKGVILLW